ncbi:ABC transporter ATP-binding protein [Fimbriiglobus ruber]|uniref:ABC transporter, ATP-binding protein n=1 Tax=Fimbriiglobus ruber TaxID=1908690 RepID=A0A225DS93_9BACT|nr:ABC transporter ATP-binding protein [Fimbriiglobus ruber]OWK44330.1 ABC transporter, ATP-binding protein [Fimbriiglobus ruber]
MTRPAIQVRDLTKQYGSVLAVDQISFEVAPGELVGFLGQNGAGKSTTMRVLTTFMPASSGYAWVAGHDVMYESMEVRRKLGYLPESVPMYPEMRVEEYLLFRAKLKQVDRTVRTKRIEDCLRRCRISEVRRRLLSTLSKGYRQRVGLADALLSDPPVLILDEPLTGLDPVQQEETLGAIQDLGGQHTVLFSSHHLPDVEKICDRVIIIDRGHIRFDDRLSNVRAQAPVLVFDVRGPQDAVAKMLKDYPGVTEVHSVAGDDGGHGFEVHTRNGQDLREAVAKKIVEAGWGLRRVDLRRPKLSDVYMRVVFQRG